LSDEHKEITFWKVLVLLTINIHTIPRYPKHTTFKCFKIKRTYTKDLLSFRRYGLLAKLVCTPTIWYYYCHLYSCFFII